MNPEKSEPTPYIVNPTFTQKVTAAIVDKKPVGSSIQDVHQYMLHEAIMKAYDAENRSPEEIDAFIDKLKNSTYEELKTRYILNRPEAIEIQMPQREELAAQNENEENEKLGKTG